MDASGGSVETAGTKGFGSMITTALADRRDEPKTDRFDRPRLSSVLHGVSFDIATLPYNARAVHLGFGVCNGGVQFGAVVGPSGWGKTHLLHCLETSLAALRVPALRAKAGEWLGSRAQADYRGVLLLDDVGDALKSVRLRHDLRKVLERRVRSRLPVVLVVTSDEPSQALRGLLPNEREWEVAVVEQPKVSEREQILVDLAGRIGVNAGPKLVSVMARHLHGNGRSYKGALERLRLSGKEWDQPEDVVRAVGVLAPVMASESWDPRDEVHDAVSATLDPSAPAVTDVCAYLMLRELGLSEGDVATFLHVSPSSAYSRACNVKAGMADPAFAARVAACKVAVLDRLTAPQV